MRNLLGLTIVGVVFVACGGGSGGGGNSVCQQIGNALCAKACTCRTGGTCAMSQDGFTIDFSSESDCRGLLVTVGCSMGDKAAYKDAAACLPLIQAATCTGSGTDGAVSYPSDTACESP